MRYVAATNYHQRIHNGTAVKRISGLGILDATNKLSQSILQNVSLVTGGLLAFLSSILR